MVKTTRPCHKGMHPPPLLLGATHAADRTERERAEVGFACRDEGVRGIAVQADSAMVQVE